MTRCVHGWDLSLNHAGFIELVDGELSDFWYVTSYAGAAGRTPNGIRFVGMKTGDRDVEGIARLDWWGEWIDELLSGRNPDFVGIEDYAVRAAQGAHYLGELGGLARLTLWRYGIPFRLVDVSSVKMFAVHDGGCSLDYFEKKAADRWNLDFDGCNQPTAPKAKKENRQTSEDLTIAYAVAKIVDTEARLRAGELRLDELDHEKEIRVFNRTTKAHPENVLSREWTVKP